MTHVLPLRTGWDSAPDGPDEYPQDLPPEWRLAYYANDFWGVLVPHGIWREAGPAGAVAWVADTPARFRFFLELDAGDRESGSTAVAAALGDRLGGLVGTASALASAPGAGPSRLLRVATEPGQTVPLAGWGLAWEVPVPLTRDLRGARAWVEARVRGQGLPGVDATATPGAAPPILALLGECRFEDLARWQAMLELMGLA
jgi:hypothetical protein